MKLADFPSVEALSTVEKLELVDEIWAAVGADLKNSKISAEEKQILDERWAAFEQNPNSALTLEQLMSRVNELRG